MRQTALKRRRFCRTDLRIAFAAAIALAMSVVIAGPVRAQGRVTVRITRHTLVMESPRGDSFSLGAVEPGAVLEVIARQGNWIQVVTPSTMSRPRGWIPARAVAVSGALPAAIAGPARPARPVRKGETLIRGFGQASALRFAADHSFETILGSAFGSTFGGGAQVVFPNGGFVQGSVERFRKTGARVFVSGNEIFTLPIPDVVTITPIQVTGGYRDPAGRRVVPYVGVGVGWQQLREESPTTGAVTDGHVSYHLLGGVEIPAGSWFAVAGEIQLTGAPSTLGNTGISALYKESNLGGVSFRVKVIIGK